MAIVVCRVVLDFFRGLMSDGGWTWAYCRLWVSSEVFNGNNFDGLIELFHRIAEPLDGWSGQIGHFFSVTQFWKMPGRTLGVFLLDELASKATLGNSANCVHSKSGRMCEGVLFFFFFFFIK